MDRNELNEKIVDCLCEEFQSVWLIDVNDKIMIPFKFDEEDSVSEAQDKVDELKLYDKACKWYAESVVLESDRNRFIEHTQLDYVIEKLSEDNRYSVEYSRLNEGVINYNQVLFSKIINESGKIEYVVLGFRDIDIRKKCEYDDLTGLYNRQVFFQKAEQLIMDYPDDKFDLILSDVVDFKEINESYGVTVGDNILRWLGNYLSTLKGDKIVVGRYGGDQMVILGEHTYMEKLIDFERAEDFQIQKINNGLPNFVIKFGMYENVPSDKSILSSCDKAHIALNSIKHQYDKHMITYNDSFRREIDNNRRIESSMHAALEQDQFKVYYQPKHDAITGRLVGAEALVRWIHPEYGFMSPGDFIPLFEKNGFVVETDYYVWKRSCENIRRWKDMGIKTVPVSVNASKLTFQQDDMLDRLQTFVRNSEIDSDELHIEITETLMTEDVDALVGKLTEIRKKGYCIELDDFGAGYSSMNILSILPMDVVKLDMSFMKQFGDEKRTKVLAACIRLAKDLGFKTVSEGVEFKEQCDMLCLLGVDAIQGYYYSKPLPEYEFEQYMRNCMG